MTMKSPNAILHTNLPLLQVNDARDLDALLADAVVAQCLLTRLSDTVALVAPEMFDALNERLLKLRHLPRVVEILRE